MKRIMCLCLLHGLLCLSVKAQLDTKNTKWMEYLEELALEEADENLLENLFSDLSYLSEHPFNLHTVTKEELERLPFLSDIQVENLLYYIYRYSPLYSIYELKNVEEMDLQTIEYLLPFVYLEEKKEVPETLKARHVLRYGKQELLFRYDHCFQEKAGYRDDPVEEKQAHPSRYYLGEPYYASLKYGFQYKEQIQFGFVMEKDAGEVFWNSQHKGPDYFSSHLVLKEMGVLKSLFIGDYRLAFGQGLVINTDFSLVNTSDVMNTGRRTGANIKRHSSNNEANYLRGGAATLGIGKIELSLFYSQRSVDASADDSIITSIKTDGLRRTVNDMTKKDQAQTRILGGNVQWKQDFFSCGLTALYHDFSGKRLEPEWKPYNTYFLRGLNNYNVGIDYTVRRKKLLFQGETAFSKNGARAAIHSLQLYPGSGFSFIFRHQYLAKDYQAHYAAVSGASNAQNMNSRYLGVVIHPFASWKISASADFTDYPWLKYLIDAPSKAKSALLSLDYTPKSNILMNLRYRYREKMKNFELPMQATKTVLPYEQHNIRYQLNLQPSSGLTLKTQINGSLYQSEMEPVSKGYMVSQNISYAKEKLPIRGDFYISYFHTDDWSSRISSYEKSILYAFSVPSFSGEGFRSCINLRWALIPAVTLYLKLAWTHYLDRDVISSGLEAIDGCDKIDFYGLIKIKI